MGQWCDDKFNDKTLLTAITAQGIRIKHQF